MPLRPARTAKVQLQDKVSLTEEGMRRVRAESGTAGTRVQRSDVDLAQLLRQRAQAMGTGPDLSKQAVTMPLADPNTAGLKSVLWSSDISDADLGHINGAIDAATPAGSQLSNDPAVELTLRKMKLDYIRDNLVPEDLRGQVGEAIAGYVCGTRLDADRMSMQLDAYAIEQSGGRTAYAGATAASQQHANAMLALVAGSHYRTPEEASASFEHSIGAIQTAMLAQVDSWRDFDQQRGRAAVYTRIAAIRDDWARFVHSAG